HTRLMYIGVTRAIKSVYLSAVLKQEDTGLVNPDTHSLLSSVWSAIRDTKLVEFIPADGKPNEKVMERMSINPLQRPSVLRRIPISKLPRPSKKKIVKDFSVNNQSNSQQEVGESLPQRVLLNSQIGDFIHEALQTFLLKNDLLSKHNLDIQKQRWQQNLLRHGFDLRTIQNAVEYIEDSLQKTLSSRELGWIFDHSQTESVAEYELQSKDTDVIQNHVIDRSFIDLEGIRWIIDYKSTKKPDHTPEDQFIVKQVALYQSQLQRYRNLFRTEQNKGVKTALLFTNIPRLVEVETSSL
ncbi:MAG: PD-(D/E)XK nuclease family protein, partial [Pseudomonadota bacterium]|nr:PD-(D/E)XK nuclease family protein [Pseudomonadota bacterium]